MVEKPIKNPTVVCSAFVEKDKRFLLVFCPIFKVWRVPGGRMEANETLEETLIREMVEEIGIKIKSPEFLGYGQDQQYHFPKSKKISRLLMFFHVKIDKEPKIDSNEAEEFKWVTWSELKNQGNKEGGLTDFFNKNPNFKL